MLVKKTCGDGIQVALPYLCKQKNCLRMYITLTVLALTAVLFATGKIRSDIVALGALIVLMLTGVLTPAEALSGFSSPVVIMMTGLFVGGGAVLQTGLAKMISAHIIGLAGGNETRLFFMVVTVTAAIGAFVSNTGTVALMLPIIVSMAAGARLNVSRLLMPLAFASSLGGMLTLIGTPPNLVIQDTLTAAGYEPLSFFAFMPVGLVALAVGVAVMFPLSRWLLGRGEQGRKTTRTRGKTLRQLVSEYRLADNIARYIVTADSGVEGKTVAELDIHSRYGLTVLEIRREQGAGNRLIKTIEQKLAEPDTVLRQGDIIYIMGPKDSTRRMAHDLRLRNAAKDNTTDSSADALDFYDLGMAEIVIMPASRLIGRQLREAALRTKYSINVIAIRRAGKYITENLHTAKLHSADVLLVQGTWDNIALLCNDEDRWVVLGQPLREAAKVTLDHKAPLAAVIMLAMVATMVFDFIPVPPVAAVMAAGVLMVLSGCFKNVEAAYKTINWESVVLIAAMMPMSVALEKTGASAIISHSMADTLGTAGPLALLAGIYATTSLLSLFISNTTTAVLMAPIALSSATELGVSPYPMLFAVTLGASMCFASPFSTPPNALVMQAGRYTFMDYVKVGLPLQVAIGSVMMLVLPLLFPF